MAEDTVANNMQNTWQYANHDSFSMNYEQNIHTDMKQKIQKLQMLLYKNDDRLAITLHSSLLCKKTKRCYRPRKKTNAILYIEKAA